jgi:radical SAM protein (TIGR01212 family)
MKTNIEKIPLKSAQIFSWGNTRPYNAYVDYLKERFGGRVQKVTVDAGFTCPNRDGSKGYGGCTYCNNDAFTPSTGNSDMSIREQLDLGMAYVSKRYAVDKFLVYFQPYSNTYAPLSRLQQLYEEALSHPGVVGLSIGTRPDCIDEEKIAYLQSLAGDYYISIEYGLESPYSRTLKWINRMHDFRCWEEAIMMSAGRGLDVTTHIILGFPTESREEMLRTAEILSRYPIDSLKIHHLHVVKKTVLAKRYKDKPFHLFGYQEYIELVMNFLQRLRPDIRIQRLCGETHPDMLIGPQWGMRCEGMQRRVEREMQKRNVWQGYSYYKNNV